LGFLDHGTYPAGVPVTPTPTPQRYHQQEDEER